MLKLLVVVCVLALLRVTPAISAEADDGSWEVTLASRRLDLTTHQARQTVTMTLTNTAPQPLSSFYTAIDSLLAGKVAYIGAKVKSATDEEGEPLLVVASPLRGKKGTEGYLVRLFSPVQSQESVKVEVELVFIDSVKPFPREISQNEKQLVQFMGNAYIFSPYPIKSQSSSVVLPSTTIESFTRVAPTTTNDNEITYGPYSDQSPYSTARVTIHYENNGPFLTVISLDRLIEVSHWGNIAVEEHIYIKHTGATLKGPYSRFDYQRVPNSGISSVKDFKTLLPAAAQDVYYRDEIGNISTSHLWGEEDYVELELRPRFPLFGGWQTRYYIGYNIPSYEYLYHSGSRYLLKMRLVDHIMDNQLVNTIVLRIVLPEGAKNIQFKAPYSTEQKPTEVMKTYLDTVGRPVVVVTKTNLVEQHIQDFELSYEFASWMLLQEPLLVVAALYIFFLLIIVVVRLDFSITKDVTVLAKQQASVTMEKIVQAHYQRSLLLTTSYQETIATFKQSKDLQAFRKAKKGLDDKVKSCSETIAKLMKGLQSMEPEGYTKVVELQKKCADLKVIIDENCSLAESLVGDRISKTHYLNEDKKNTSRMQRLQQETEAIAKLL